MTQVSLVNLPSELWIDFETYSECDIKTRGGMNYAKHPSTQTICMGYAFDDDEPLLYTPDKELHPEVISYVEAGLPVYAHSATFDFRIWNFIGHEQFGWPALSLDQMVDTMALCQTFQVPASLADAGAALNISMPKNPEGAALIRACCQPQKNGVQPTPWGVNAEKFKRLYMYCLRDIEAMRQVANALPRKVLIPREQALWELTYKMNTVGLPVDYGAILKIKNQLDSYIARALRVVPKLSGGAFSTLGQIQKIRDWCEENGYFMESLDAATVAAAIDDVKCSQKVREVLCLRQELGRSSTAKYTKLVGLACKGDDGNYWIHDNLAFHGAGPGRWAGRGFQVHNLPRASVEDPEAYVQCFYHEDGFGPDTTWVAKGLIRPMIKAPEGYALLVSDYSGIENRLLHWHANDEDALNDFRAGVDQYKTMASARYHVEYKAVTKPQRQMGKVIILGCGYQMGKDKFKETAKVQFGLDIELAEAEAAVKAYRAKYTEVVQLWDGLKNAAARTVISGQQTTYNRITFGLAKVKGIKWLAMKLPSGKCIYYMSPEIHHLFIPDYESMGRVPTVTHMGVNPYSKKWGRLKLIPGRITENAVQGTAREVMAQGMLNVKERMPEVTQIATVHDEDIALIKISDIRSDTLDRFNECLCDIEWARDLPLKAEGWIGSRYKK